MAPRGVYLRPEPARREASRCLTIGSEVHKNKAVITQLDLVKPGDDIGGRRGIPGPVPQP
jgi:hypothetical protein